MPTSHGLTTVGHCDGLSENTRPSPLLFLSSWCWWGVLGDWAGAGWCYHGHSAASTQLIAPPAPAPAPAPPRPRQINLANIEPRQLYQLTFYCGKIKLITTADDEEELDQICMKHGREWMVGSRSSPIDGIFYLYQISLISLAIIV